MVKRAQENKFITINTVDLRDFTTDNYKSVDDRPYGGGAGMIMEVEPIYKAVLDLKQNKIEKYSKKNTRTILFSARGHKYTQNDAKRLLKYKNLILICGHYEGVDQRVGDYIVDEEICIGPYILTGGEIPAMVLVDSVARLIPGVLGNKESPKDESFSKENYIEYPQYTRPAEFVNENKIISKVKAWKVPEVLLSGNHKEIEKWRVGKTVV